VRMGTGTLVLITIKYRCSEMYYYACTPRKLEYNTFKSRLNTDTYWQNQEIIYDFRAQLQGTGSRSEAVWRNTEPTVGLGLEVWYGILEFNVPLDTV